VPARPRPHEHPTRAGGFEIDVVHAGAGANHQGEVAAGFEGRFRHFGAADHQYLGIADGSGKGVAVELGLVDHLAAERLQIVEAAGWQDVGQ
jgi:hypothetical protein